MSGATKPDKNLTANDFQLLQGPIRTQAIWHSSAPSMPNQLHCQDPRMLIPALYYNMEAVAANGLFDFTFNSTSVALNGS